MPAGRPLPLGEAGGGAPERGAPHAGAGASCPSSRACACGGTAPGGCRSARCTRWPRPSARSRACSGPCTSPSRRCGLGLGCPARAPSAVCACFGRRRQPALPEQAMLWCVRAGGGAGRAGRASDRGGTLRRALRMRCSTCSSTATRPTCWQTSRCGHRPPRPPCAARRRAGAAASRGGQRSGARLAARPARAPARGPGARCPGARLACLACRARSPRKMRSYLAAAGLGLGVGGLQAWAAPASTRPAAQVFSQASLQDMADAFPRRPTPCAANLHSFIEVARRPRPPACTLPAPEYGPRGWDAQPEAYPAHLPAQSWTGSESTPRVALRALAERKPPCIG